MREKNNYKIVSLIFRKWYIAKKKMIFYERLNTIYIQQY